MFEAARCLEQPDFQVGYAVKDGLPPITETLYQDPRIVKAYPFADLLLETFKEAEHATREPGLQRHLACGAAHAAPTVLDQPEE